MKNLVIIFLMTVAVLSTINARENPFVPINTEDNVGKATQIKDIRKNFKFVKATLPSSARILKKLELHYQNLDGSIESKEVSIDEKIDWHDELILQRVNNQTPAEVLPARGETVVALPKAPPRPQIQKKSFQGVLDFTVQGSKINIYTDDEKLRDFLITEPYKIVIDFKREIDFYTKSYNLKNQKVLAVTFGKHSGYYRMVLTLDGQYRYKMEKISNGYSIELY